MSWDNYRDVEILLKHNPNKPQTNQAESVLRFKVQPAQRKSFGSLVERYLEWVTRELPTEVKLLSEIDAETGVPVKLKISLFGLPKNMSEGFMQLFGNEVRSMQIEGDWKPITPTYQVFDHVS